MESRNPLDSRKPIDWYRSPIEPRQLRSLYERSDLQGFLQAGGYLAILGALAAAVLYSAHHFCWEVTVLLIFVYGTCFGFMPAAIHETNHYTVFKTRVLNTLFVHVFAFLGWTNHYMFEYSHARHHRSTLHPPDDLEVVLPLKASLWEVLRIGIINWPGMRNAFVFGSRMAFGRFLGDWENTLCPSSRPDKRTRVIRWSRATLAGHALILVLAITFKVYLAVVLITFGAFYGNWLLYLIGTTQHIGLTDKTTDFRLCCRTIRLNPVVEFLYWRMNYHLEHHMYVGVPCYNLGKLRKAIEDDLPPAPMGIVAAWREINSILKRQKMDPGYQHMPHICDAIAGPVTSFLKQTQRALRGLNVNENGRGVVSIAARRRNNCAE